MDNLEMISEDASLKINNIEKQIEELRVLKDKIIETSDEVFTPDEKTRVVGKINYNLRRLVEEIVIVENHVHGSTAKVVS